MDFRNTKIRIKSPEHSEAFQRAVFEAGGRWADLGKNVSFTDKKFLYVNTQLILTCGHDESLFESDDRKEIQWPPKKSKGAFVELGLEIQAEMDRLRFAKTVLEEACIIIAARGDDNSRYYAQRALEAVK